MKLVFITLLVTSLNAFGMDCVTIKSLAEIEKYLSEHGRALGQSDEQLQTNLAFVYRLPKGEVAVVPNLMKPEYKGMLFANEECFQEYLRNDRFPIENEEKEMYEYDLDGQRNIHENIGKYHEYLNKRLKLTYPSLDRNNMQEYYAGILKIKKKERIDVLALGAVLGELHRKEIKGRWALEKLYGTFNPYFRPMIVHPTTNRIELPYDKLAGMIKWKEKDASKFFFVLPMTPYPTLDTRKQGGTEIIELQ